MIRASPKKDMRHGGQKGVMQDTTQERIEEIEED